jgi:hypothetical protein
MRIKTFVIIFALLLPCGGSAYSHIEVANTHDDVRNEFVSVKGYGAIGDGLIDDTNAIQSAIDSGAKHIYLPVGNYLVTKLDYSFDVTFFGSGKIFPTSEHQTSQYGSIHRAGVKSGHTRPLDKHGGFLIGGEGPTEHGVLLKSQRVSSFDAISSREPNPIEFQLYPNSITGIIVSDGTSTVNYLRGFSGSFVNIYESDTFWVGEESYEVIKKASKTSLKLSRNVPAYPKGISSFILYETSDVVVNINDKLVTNVAGEVFRAPGNDHNLIINGKRYDLKVISDSSGMLAENISNGINIKALFRRVLSENYIAIFRLQRLKGNGTEETLSISARPNEYLVRVGRTADGIGRYSPLRFKGAASGNDPFPKNEAPQTMLFLGSNGNNGIHTISPASSWEVRDLFDVEQGGHSREPYEISRISVGFNNGSEGDKHIEFGFYNDYSAGYIQGKTTESGNPANIYINPEGGGVTFGAGNTSAHSKFTFNGDLSPHQAGKFSLGKKSYKWSEGHMATIFLGATNSVMWTSGSGSPEGVLNSPVGSMYTRTDGGIGNTLYVKESGAGANGWVSK